MHDIQTIKRNCALNKERSAILDRFRLKSISPIPDNVCWLSLPNASPFRIRFWPSPFWIFFSYFRGFLSQTSPRSWNWFRNNGSHCVSLYIYASMKRKNMITHRCWSTAVHPSWGRLAQGSWSLSGRKHLQEEKLEVKQKTTCDSFNTEINFFWNIPFIYFLIQGDAVVKNKAEVYRWFLLWRKYFSWHIPFIYFSMERS